MEEAWGDVSGVRLDPQVAKLARKEEIDYIHKMNLYTKVSKAQCRIEMQEKGQFRPLDRH